MSDRVKVRKTYYWDVTTPWTSDGTSTGTETTTEIATLSEIENELSVREINLLKNVFDRIVKEEWVYAVVGIVVGAFITFVWYRRQGKSVV
jgi:Mg/Co/Ni transporter MgtE